MDKTAVRDTLRTARRALTDAQRRSLSARIHQHLREDSRWRAARTVGLYRAMRTEVHTKALFDDGPRIALPRVVGPGEPLVFEVGGSPVALADLDLLLVPAVGISVRGDRLGMGGGYYDRTLARSDVPRFALVYGVQRRHVLPTGPHDVPMHGWIDEAGWWAVR